MSTDVCWRPPDDQRLPASPPFRSLPSARSAEAYAAALEQFRVAEAPRYQPGILNGKPSKLAPSWCNLYCIDATDAMGAPLPRKDKKGNYLTANQLIELLLHAGVDGYANVSPAKALQLAEAGCPVVPTWFNPNGHGHMAMLRPQAVVPSRFEKKLELRIAQAGLRCFENGTLESGFGARPVTFFAHP